MQNYELTSIPLRTGETCKGIHPGFEIQGRYQMCFDGAVAASWTLTFNINSITQEVGIILLKIMNIYLSLNAAKPVNGN